MNWFISVFIVLILKHWFIFKSYFVTHVIQTILFICVASAHAAILQKKKTPSEQLMMQMTGIMYDNMKRTYNAPLTKKEFTKWCSDTMEELGLINVEGLYDLFMSGGPAVVEEEPEDGIPQLFVEQEETAEKDVKTLRTPMKNPVFIPSDTMTELPVKIIENDEEDAFAGTAEGMNEAITIKEDF